MDIYIKKVKKFEINTVDELETFIKDSGVKKNFVKFPNETISIVEKDIKSTDKINLKELKGKFINKYFKTPSCLNVQYWIERGHSENISTMKVTNEQTRRSNKFHKIRRENPTAYDGCWPTQKLYWIKRGYSNEEAMNMVSERQSTFSKEKLIDKFGEKDGLKLLDKRNKKWFDSLKKNNDWDELSLKKGRNGLNQIKTLSKHIEHYGETEGKIKFAKRYWGVSINSVDEFNSYQTFLSRDRTTLFYDKHYRELILNQQNCKCGECGISNTNSKFHLHHIDYNKLNDSRKNLIFLCHSCHSKTTNSDRNIWINHYKNINKKYYDKEI